MQRAALLYLEGRVALYQALYRKYRPRSFDDVVGQQHVTETLRTQVKTGRLGHAYLFIGTRGTGKTTCAKLLAKAVNCIEPENGNPCGKCAACRGIDDGSVLDVVEIDAASNNGVENVRALRDEAIFSPASVKKRVYIIDEVHMLSISAFNALLKILEEPPEHLMFILATTELRKVPATILSRCQRYSFRRLDVDVITQRLNYVAEQEGLRLTPEAAALLARLADGGMRDALSLLDQCSGAEIIDAQSVYSAMGLAGTRQIARLLDAVADQDSVAALRLFSELWSDGKDPAGLLSELCALMRDVLMLSLAPKGGRELLSGAYEEAQLREFAGKFTHAELLRAMERIQGSLASIRDNPSPRTAAELCLVALCDPRLCDGLPELLARVSRLEERPVAAAPTRVDVADEPRERFESYEPYEQYEPAPPPSDDERPPWDEPEPIPAPRRPVQERRAPQVEPKPEPKREPKPEGKAAADWNTLAQRVKARLPVGVGMLLDDPLQITGKLDGGELTLNIASGFASMMLGKQEQLDIFRSEAEKLTGGAVRVTVQEMDSDERMATRSLEELKKFTQVKFV